MQAGSLLPVSPGSNHRSPGVGDCVSEFARSSSSFVLIVGPKLFIEPGTKAFFRLSSVSGPGL